MMENHGQNNMISIPTGKRTGQSPPPLAAILFLCLTIWLRIFYSIFNSKKLYRNTLYRFLVGFTSLCYLQWLHKKAGLAKLQHVSLLPPVLRIKAKRFFGEIVTRQPTPARDYCRLTTKGHLLAVGYTTPRQAAPPHPCPRSQGDLNDM
jgi:hypothetical protein